MTVTKEELHLVIKRKSPVIGHKVPFRGASKVQNKGTKNVGVSIFFPLASGLEAFRSLASL